MAPDELENMRQDEVLKRRKERVAKMKINSEIQEEVKLQTDENYKEAVDMYED